MPVNWYQTKLFQMHLCAMAFQSEMAFWPEMTFRPEIVFWPEMAIWPEIAFRQWIRMELISYILARMASKSEIPFFCQKWLFSQNWLFGQKWLFGQTCVFFCQIWLFGSTRCLAETAFWPKILFVKFEVTFWLEMSFFK